MPESNHESLRRLFDLTLAAAPADRGPLLDRECGSDTALRKRVEAMVSVAEGDRFLSEPTRENASSAVTESGFASASASAAAAATMVAPIREGPGTRIGPYKLLQLIGEGGFGSVFMAEQEKPVVRKVALKIIKLGMDTRQVVARFEQERQALAIMDHPHIARVLDAGATETGRPYFVMELVKGDPIVGYCDKNNLSIEDRLDLFAQVCNAVQHAHTKGIIHRDLKPSNVLVSTQDGKPHTKVIDFGIAKATASKLTEKTLFTEHRQLIGTPEYMSPEQAEGSLDIDTRTDVYSLGVLLYELLTGTTPFSSEELRSAAFAEIQRIIREVDPPKPSTRLSSNTGTLASVAAKRHTEPRRLGTLVRGELDWIVMKALEKDRQRRYETASGLMLDIRRYLAGEAVLAAPPSTSYRFQKFLRRNRAAVSAGSAIAASLVIGMVAFAWQAKVASDQRDLAVTAQQAEAEQRTQAEAARADALAQKSKAEEQEAEAKKQAAIAEAVAKFQTDMLASVNPANLPKDPSTGEPLKDSVTVLQAIQAAIKKLDADGEGEGALKDQPMVDAAVRTTIGNTLKGLGRYAEAEPQLRESLSIRRAALPAGHLNIAVGLSDLSSLLLAQNKLAEAEPLFREALEIIRRARPAGHPEIASGLSNLAMLLSAQNKPAEAKSLLREALEIRRSALPPEHPDIALSLNNLATLLYEDNLAEAEPLFREALAIRRAAFPAGHPDIVQSMNNLAVLLSQQNKPAEAEPLYREALAIRRATLPAQHPSIAIALSNLASEVRALNKPAEAEPLYREALAIYRATLPADHPDIATILNGLAGFLRTQGRSDEAEPLYREALAIRRSALPAGHPHIAEGLNHLAALLQSQNKPAEALPLYREAMEIFTQTLPAGHASIASTLSNLAQTQQALGQTAEARAGWDEAIAMLRKGSPDGSARLARVLWRSATARLENKDNAAALQELEQAVAMAEKTLPAEHADLKRFRETLAKCKATMALEGEQANPDADTGGG